MSNLPLTVRTEVRDPVLKVVDFSIWDEKGRKLGVVIEINEYEYTLAPDTAICGYRREPGRSFALNVQATRDGKLYGASQRDTHHATYAEAATQGDVKAEATRLRYFRKYVA